MQTKTKIVSIISLWILSISGLVVASNPNILDMFDFKNQIEQQKWEKSKSFYINSWESQVISFAQKIKNIDFSLDSGFTIRTLQWWVWKDSSWEIEDFQPLKGYLVRNFSKNTLEIKADYAPVTKMEDAFFSRKLKAGWNMVAPAYKNDLCRAVTINEWLWDSLPYSNVLDVTWIAFQNVQNDEKNIFSDLFGLKTKKIKIVKKNYNWKTHFEAVVSEVKNLETVKKDWNFAIKSKSDAKKNFMYENLAYPVFVNNDTVISGSQNITDVQGREILKNKEHPVVAMILNNNEKVISTSEKEIIIPFQLISTLYPNDWNINALIYNLDIDVTSNKWIEKKYIKIWDKKFNDWIINQEIKNWVLNWELHILLKDNINTDIIDINFEKNNSLILDSTTGLPFCWKENIISNLDNIRINYTKKIYDKEEIKAANYLASRGIIKSNYDNIDNYKLDKFILNQDFANIIRGITGVSKKVTCDNYFKDVSVTKPNTWICYTIEALKDANIIALNKNEYFHPEKKVTKAEVIWMMIKISSFAWDYSYDVSKGTGWQEQVVAFAVKKWFVDKFTDYNALATRGFVYKVSMNIMEKWGTNNFNSNSNSKVGEFQDLLCQLDPKKCNVCWDWKIWKRKDWWIDECDFGSNDWAEWCTKDCKIKVEKLWKLNIAYDSNNEDNYVNKTILAWNSAKVASVDVKAENEEVDVATVKFIVDKDLTKSISSASLYLDDALINTNTSADIEYWPIWTIITFENLSNLVIPEETSELRLELNTTGIGYQKIAKTVLNAKAIKVDLSGIEWVESGKKLSNVETELFSSKEFSIVPAIVIPSVINTFSTNWEAKIKVTADSGDNKQKNSNASPVVTIKEFVFTELGNSEEIDSYSIYKDGDSVNAKNCVTSDNRVTCTLLNPVSIDDYEDFIIKAKWTINKTYNLKLQKTGVVYSTSETDDNNNGSVEFTSNINEELNLWNFIWENSISSSIWINTTLREYSKDTILAWETKEIFNVDIEWQNEDIQVWALIFEVLGWDGSTHNDLEDTINKFSIYIDDNKIFEWWSSDMVVENWALSLKMQESFILTEWKHKLKLIINTNGIWYQKVWKTIYYASVKSFWFYKLKWLESNESLDSVTQIDNFTRHQFFVVPAVVFTSVVNTFANSWEAKVRISVDTWNNKKADSNSSPMVYIKWFSFTELWNSNEIDAYSIYKDWNSASRKNCVISSENVYCELENPVAIDSYEDFIIKAKATEGKTYLLKLLKNWVTYVTDSIDNVNFSSDNQELDLWFKTY